MSADAIIDPVSSAEDNLLEITVTHAGKTFTLRLPPQATVEDVALLCESELQGEAQDGAPSTEYTVTKLLAPPPIGLINVTKDANTVLSDLVARQTTAKKQPQQQLQQQQPPNQLKLRLMASPTSAVDALRQASDAVKQRDARLADLRRRAVPARRTTTARGGIHTISDASNAYVFGEIRPLRHLPDPDRALSYLHRLRDDPGICHVMQSHQFRVGLLTEMDPRLYTEANHEGTSRTLGLNRNRGEVIELRLRTDDFTGYRDYKTVRKTLCHELAHNVHGPHDKHFWALYREIEREVEHVAENQSRGGRSLAGGREGDYYEPPTSLSDDDHDHDHDHDHVDAGGWTGGTYVLGSGGSSSSTTTGITGMAGRPGANTPLGERERRARAAEERLRQRAAGGSGGSGASGSDAQPGGGSSSSSTHQ